MEDQPDKARDEKGRLLPGHTGNPAGRPRNAPLIAPIIRKLMEMSPEDLKEFRPRTVAELLAQKQLNALYKTDDIRRFEALTDRIEGKPVQPTEHTGDPDRPVFICKEEQEFLKDP